MYIKSHLSKDVEKQIETRLSDVGKNARHRTRTELVEMENVITTHVDQKIDDTRAAFEVQLDFLSGCILPLSDLLDLRKQVDILTARLPMCEFQETAVFKDIKDSVEMQIDRLHRDINRNEHEFQSQCTKIGHDMRKHAIIGDTTYRIHAAEIHDTMSMQEQTITSMMDAQALAVNEKLEEMQNDFTLMRDQVLSDAAIMKSMQLETRQAIHQGFVHLSMIADDW